MSWAIMSGRWQNLDTATLEDMSYAYALASFPDMTPVKGLMACQLGRHARISREPDVLGQQEGLALLVAGCDSHRIRPEACDGDAKETAERFMSHEENPHSFFERMFIIKEGLHELGVPLARVPIVSHYPVELYPSLACSTDPPESEIAFQYFGVTEDRHFKRLEQTSSSGRTVFYRDLRGMPEARGEPFATMERISRIRSGEYLLLADGFGAPLEAQHRRAIDHLIHASTWERKDAVIAIAPSLSLEQPFTRFAAVHQYLADRDADQLHVHITLIPEALAGNSERNAGYLPRRYESRTLSELQSLL